MYPKHFQWVCDLLHAQNDPVRKRSEAHKYLCSELLWVFCPYFFLDVWRESDSRLCWLVLQKFGLEKPKQMSSCSSELKETPHPPPFSKRFLMIFTGPLGSYVRAIGVTPSALPQALIPFIILSFNSFVRQILTSLAKHNKVYHETSEKGWEI